MAWSGNVTDPLLLKSSGNLLGPVFKEMLSLLLHKERSSNRGLASLFLIMLTLIKFSLVLIMRYRNRGEMND